MPDKMKKSQKTKFKTKPSFCNFRKRTITNVPYPGMKEKNGKTSKMALFICHTFGPPKDEVRICRTT